MLAGLAHLMLGMPRLSIGGKLSRSGLGGQGGRGNQRQHDRFS
jgi:hypothetical protein